MNTNPPEDAPGGPVLVAVGIVVREAPNIHRNDGVGKSGPGMPSPTHEILITRRPEHTVFGGYWELPGGKLDSGESPDEAVVRELHEEVGITVEVDHPLSDVEHRYPHAHVRLHPRVCRLAEGSPPPRALHVTEFLWCPLQDLARYRFPPANDAIVDELIAWLRRGGGSR